MANPAGGQKPKYETPILTPLGELAKGTGQACNTGMSVTGASCKVGYAAKNCHTGSDDA